MIKFFIVVFLVLFFTVLPSYGQSSGAYSVRTLDNFIALIEKIERHSLAQDKPLIVIANYVRKLAFSDSNKWNTLLAPANYILPDWVLTSNERSILTGMVRHQRTGSYEEGVVKTPFGEVAMGRVITGICAGFERKNISLSAIQYLSSEPIDNLYAATVAGDLGLLSLWNPYPPYSLSPSNGYWSPNTQCPNNFTLNSYSYNTSLAKVRGAIDGFLLGYKLSDWKSTGVRLGQLLRMYYQHGIVYDTDFAACKRTDTFKKLQENDTLVNQTALAAYATKLVWSSYWDYNHVSTYNIPYYVNRANALFGNIINYNIGTYSCPARQDQGCSLSADIVFVLDESGSISYSNYQTEKEFVKKIIEAFDISPYQTRVAVVEYGSYAHESIRLGQYSSKSTLMCAVNGLTYSGGGTNTALALQVAYTILKNDQAQQASSGQITDPQIIILLTDGYSNTGVSGLKPVVDAIKNNITGITMIAVGVGGYNRAELELIATDPSKHVFDVSDFSKLIGNLTTLLQKETCETPTSIKLVSQNANTSGDGQVIHKTHMTGFVSPGGVRYFEVDSGTLQNAENFTLQVVPSYGNVSVYGSRNDSTPDEDSHDFKHQGGDVIPIVSPCQGYSASNCPSLYISVVGGNSSKSCFDPQCSVPDQIKFELKTEGYGSCLSRPCQNGGSCSSVSYGYRCICPLGYSGQHCEKRLCVHDSCLNGGTCTDTINGPNCTCPTWYSGRQCEIQDPCGNYTELSSPSLSRYYYNVPSSPSCGNRNLTVGWYRFTGAAGSTMLTNACISRYNCGGSYYTSHMSGNHPSVPGTTYYNTLCMNMYEYCCYYRFTIQVRNCGSYYVYKLDHFITYSYYCYGLCGSGTSEYYCVSRPCQNGGTCHGTSSGYTCTCPQGYTGNLCQTKEKGNVTCDPKYMEVEIPRSLYPNIHTGNFHLNDPNCRATALTSNTIRIRTGLKLCGTNFTEYGDTLEFENMLKIDSRYPNLDQSVITRQSSTVMRFYCRYSRSQLVSTSFSPAREIVPVSEGGFGNFTFTMFMYKTADYNVKYQSFEYPVQVSLNEPLWIMFQVVNATDLLVVFAETCFATPSASPNSYPKYVFLTNGCINDSTMAYSYNPLSSYQKFTIRSFRFIQDPSKLIYIHCKLMVCHRFSSNSRCSRGCINSGRKRREVSGFEDTSSSKELFTGPISIKNTQNSNGNQGSQHNLGTGLTIGVSVVGALLVAVCAIVIAKIVTTKWLKPNKVSPATARNIYAFDGPAELQFGDMNKPSDGPAELQFGDMNKPSDGPAALQLGDMDKPSELNI